MLALTLSKNEAITFDAGRLESAQVELPTRARIIASRSSLSPGSDLPRSTRLHHDGGSRLQVMAQE